MITEARFGWQFDVVNENKQIPYARTGSHKIQEMEHAGYELAEVIKTTTKYPIRELQNYVQEKISQLGKGNSRSVVLEARRIQDGTTHRVICCFHKKAA